MLPFPTESVKVLAATSIVTALLEDAVHVTEYDEPEPDRVPRLHPDAEISPTMKSVASSLNVKVREMAAVLVVPPEAGAVSYTHLTLPTILLV